MSMPHQFYAMIHALYITFLFQDVLDSKNSAIRDLQYELARVCKVYNNNS